jgi:hypothetical protein
MILEKNQSSMTYAMIEEWYGLNGIGRISYGIAVCADANVDGSATIVDAIHDITASKERIAAFVWHCNQLGLSVIHLMDAIEDFLAR